MVSTALGTDSLKSEPKGRAFGAQLPDSSIHFAQTAGGFHGGWHDWQPSDDGEDVDEVFGGYREILGRMTSRAVLEWSPRVITWCFPIFTPTCGRTEFITTYRRANPKLPQTLPSMVQAQPTPFEGFWPKPKATLERIRG